MARRLNVKLGLDNADFKNGIKESQKSVSQLGEMFRNALSFAGGQLLVDGIKNGLKEGATSGIDFNKTIQQSQIAFSTLLKSSTAAKEEVTALWNLGKDTPLEFPQLVTASERMLAFKFNVKDVIPDLKIIGDTASGLGKGAAGVDAISLALGQMKVKGKVSGDEMLQLTEAGVDAWGYLAKAIGKTVGETQKLSEKGMIPSNEAISVILEGMQKDFDGMMEKQAKAYDGQMSTLKDTTKEAFGTVIKPEFEWLTNNVLPEAITKIGQFTDGFKLNGLKGGISAAFSAEDAQALNAFVDTISSEITVLKNDIESVGEPALNFARIILTNWDKIGPVVYGAATAFAAVKVVQTLTPIVTTATAAINNIVFAFQAWQGGAATLSESLMFIMGPAGWIALGLGTIIGLTTAIYSYNSAQDEMSRKSIEEANAASTQLQKNEELINKYIDLKTKAGDSAVKTDELKQVTQELTEKIPGATDVINQQTMAYRDQKIALEELIRTQTKSQLEAGYLDASKNLDAQKKAYEDAASKEAFLRKTQGKTWQEAGYKNYSEYEADYNKNISFWDATQSVWSAATSGNANYYDKDMLSKAIKNKDETEKALKASQNAMDAWNKFQTQGSGFSPNFSGGSAPSGVQDKLKAIADANTKAGDDGSSAADKLKAAMASMASTSEEYMKKMTSGIKSFLNELKSTRDEFESFGNMFEKTVIEKFSPDKIESRLNQSLKKIQDWQKNLNELQAKGIDANTLDNLRSLGLSGSGVVAGLNKMSIDRLNQSLSKMGQIRGAASDEAYKSVTYKHQMEISGRVDVYGIDNEGQLSAVKSIVAKDIATEQDRYNNGKNEWRITK